MKILEEVNNLINEINPALLATGGLLTAGTVGGVGGIPGVPNLAQLGHAYDISKKLYKASIYAPTIVRVAKPLASSAVNKIEQHI